MTNAVLPEAGSAHVEELSDPYLLWFWNSNVRSTAIVLDSAGQRARTPKRSHRADRALADDGAQGRPLGQHAGERLRDGGAGRLLPEVRNRGAGLHRRRDARRRESRARGVPGAVGPTRQQRRCRWRRCWRRRPPGAIAAADVQRARAPGTLFYTARLRYASDELFQEGLDNGFRIERTYAPYVENGARPAATVYKAGDLMRVTLTFRLTKERRFVAVTDPLPADSSRSSRGSRPRPRSRRSRTGNQAGRVRGRLASRGGSAAGSITCERHDDRVQLFATRLGEGRHDFSYIVRATTAGTFRTAPARAEEMYEPEVFGRTRDGGDRGEAMKFMQICVQGGQAGRSRGDCFGRPPRCRRPYCRAGLWIRLGPLPASCSTGRPTSTVVVDRHGAPLYEALSGDGTRSVRLDAGTLPNALVAATIAAEDRRFWSPPRRRSRRHRARAATEHRRAASRRGRIDDHPAGGEAAARPAGAATPARLSRPRCTKRSWRCASNIACTKREILALYLNLAAYGNQIAGVERASQAYFGVERRC